MCRARRWHEIVPVIRIKASESALRDEVATSKCSAARREREIADLKAQVGASKDSSLKKCIAALDDTVLELCLEGEAFFIQSRGILTCAQQSFSPSGIDTI